MTNEWQPIETAPKDGTTVIVNAPDLIDGCTMAFIENGRWHSIFNGMPFLKHVIPPTHWMPLPKPPEETK